MVSLNFGQGNIYMDDRLHKNLLEMRDNLRKKDEHCIIIIDGPPGVGKSSLAQQCAAVIDEDFPQTASEKIHNTVETFINYIVRCPKKKGGVAAILDEGLNGANAKRAMSNLNVQLQSVLAEIRQKNMFLIVCAPFVFELDKSIAVGLSDALLHCYKNRSGTRIFRFYGRNTKTKLYMNPNNKRFYQYSTRSNFYGKLGQGYVMNEEEYRKFKAQGLKKYITKDSLQILSPEEMVRARETELIDKLIKSGMSLTDVARRFGMSRTTIYSRIENQEKPESFNEQSHLDPLIRGEVGEKISEEEGK